MTMEKGTADYCSSLDYKRQFFRKHGGMARCETSPMYNNDTYCKTYFAEDGAQLTEINESAWRTETYGTEGGYSITEPVKVWRTEIWHTDDAASRIWYEKI